MPDSEPEPPLRKQPAHGVLFLEPQSTIVFLTACTKDRVPWLSNAIVYEALCQAWNEAQAWLVGRYVIMPDHIHLFAAPAYASIELGDWVQFWKSTVTKRIRRTGTLEIPSRPWQASHWDTRLRGWQSYSQKWDYVRNNPVRHGLVARAEEWPYQGEIHSLNWD